MKSSTLQIPSRGRSFSAVLASVGILLSGLPVLPIQATTETWVGNTNTDLATATNWDTTVAPVTADDLVFGTAGTSGTTLTNTLTAGLSLNSLTFNSGASAFTLGGNQLTLTSGITDNATNTETIGLALALGGANTWSVGSGGTLAVSGVISGANSLNKTGAGTLTLSGLNTFSGGLTVSAGNLSYASNTALGGTSGTAGAVTLNGGTLVFTAAGVDNTHAITVGASGGTINTTGAGTFRFGAANTLLGSGPLTITGTGSLVTTGQGVVVLNNSNTYNGNVTLQSGGVLEYANVSGIATDATVTVGNNGNLSAQNTIISNNVIVNSGGVLGFQNTGNGVFAGNITLNGAATAQLKNWWSTAAQNGTITGNISGTGSLTISNNTATLTLLGANTYTGNTVIGTGATLVDVEPVSRTYAGVISGAGAYIKGGPGTLTLTGANTYTGATTIRSGTVQVGDGTSGSLASTTTLTFGDTGKLNYQGVSTGSSQSLGATTFSAGAGTVQSTYGTSGNTAVTLANVVARTAGATGNFAVSGGTLTGATPTNKIVFTQFAGATPTTGALLDKGYYFNGADFAAYDTNGYVRALAYGTDTNSAASDTITAGNNIKLTATPASRVGDTLLTLNLAGSGVDYTMSSGTLTLSGGGLIKSGGGTAGTISGGTAITTGGATELVVRTDTVGDLLTLSTPFTGSTGGLTKTGLGTLTLSGTGNSYTGATTINEGTLTLSGTYTGGSAFTVRNTGTLNINGASNGNIIVAPASGGVGIANVNAAVTLPNSNTITVGSSGGVGVLNVAADISGGNQAINVGTGGFGSLGVLNLTSGTITPGAFLVAGFNTGSSGIWNISGGSVTTSGNNGGTLGIGGTNIVNTGVLNITGGNYTSTNNTANGLSGIYVGEGAGGTGVLNISGTGVANLGGVSTSVALNIGRSNGSTGIVNLGAVSGGGSGGSGGGTINTFRVQKTGSTATGIFNFHGGTLKASTGANATFMTGLTGAYVYGEGGTVDNNGQAITIGQALLAPTGNGVTALTLGGATTGFTPGATPLVTITGGGGTGATAVSNVDSSGNLTITITNPGTGYTSTPLVTLTGATGATPTTVTATTGVNSSGGLTFQGSNTTTLTGTSTYTGTTNITAGTLALGNATNTLADTGAVNVNGGTLSLGTNSDTVGAVTLTSGTISGSTGVLTGSSYDVRSGTVSGILGGSGSALTKSTAGSVTLSGVNTYTGATQVTGGTLTVSSTGSINNSSGITINGSGAKFVQASSVASTTAITLTQGTLDGTGTVGAVTVGAGTGGIVANGNGSTGKFTMGSLTFTGAGALSLNLLGGAATTTEALAVTNAFTTSGTAGSITVNVSPTTAFNNTTYNLISYGSFSGSLADFIVGTGLTSRQNGTFGTSGNFLTLTISGDAPKWTGADNGNWVVGGTGGSSNWKLITAGTATNYIEGDTVLFDDSATGTTTIDISGANVAPTLTTFNNSTKDYVIGSTGGFGISSGGIAKTGTGKVTLTTANSYTGTTTVSAGTLNVQNSAALGASSSVTVASGAALELQGGISVDARPLTISGSGLAASPAGALRNVSGVNTYAGLLTLGANATIQSDAGSLALTNTGTITGSGFNLTLDGAGDGNLAGIIGTGTGSVIKNGAGVWTLSGVNTYTGGTTINGGTLIAGNTAAFGTGALAFGAASSGTATLNGNAITVSGLNGDSTATINNSNATAGTLTVNTTGTDTFAGALVNGSAGTLAVTKSGAGSLALSGTNTYGGATTISAGTLDYQASTAMSSSSALTIASGGTLGLSADADTTFTPASITGPAGSYTIAVNQLTGAGAGKTLTLANTLNMGSSGNNLTVSSTSGDTLLLSSQLALSNNNASSNTINLSGANMTLNAGVNFNGATNGPLLIVNANSNAMVINGTWTTGGNRWSGIQLNNGTLTMANGQAGGSSTNNGVYAILNGGTLNLNNANAIGGAAAGNNFTINGGTVDNTSGTAITLARNPVITLNGDLAFSTSGGTSANDLNLGTGAVSLGSAAGTSRTITTNGAATLTLGGIIANGTTANSLIKSGTGGLTLNGANTYSGGTTINDGTFTLGNGSNTLADTGAVTVNGGTLNVANNDTVGAVTLTSGTISGAATLSGSSYAVQSGTVSANLGGTGSLTKTTGGTVTLNGANTYSGTTTISAGTLALGVSGTIDNSTAINLGSSGSHGILDLTAKGGDYTLFSTVSGTLSGYGTVNIGTGNTLTLTGTLAPGNSAGIVTINGNLALDAFSTTNMEIVSRNGGSPVAGTDHDQVSVSGSVTFGGTLNVNLSGLTLVTGDTFQLFNAASYAQGLSGVTVVSSDANFSVSGTVWTGTDSLSNTFAFDESNGVFSIINASAVPEPATYAALLGAVALIGAVIRRRRQQS